MTVFLLLHGNTTRQNITRTSKRPKNNKKKIYAMDYLDGKKSQKNQDWIMLIHPSSCFYTKLDAVSTFYILEFLPIFLKWMVLLLTSLICETETESTNLWMKNESTNLWMENESKNLWMETNCTNLWMICCSV